jgi:hypothetical protein
MHPSHSFLNSNAMRYCTGCHRFSAGEPLFCSNCGRTYHVRLCARLHVNPRNAEVCSQCGSRELSQPQPRTPFGSSLAVTLIGYIPGLVLLICSVLLGAAFLNVILTNSQVQGELLLLLLWLGIGWYVYTLMPTPMQRAARWGWGAIRKRIRRR